MLESNSDLEAQTTTQPSSPAPVTGSPVQNVAVQLFDHGTGSGVKKAVSTDRWARSRAKAARATIDDE